ncbi:hypothetical protein ABE488_00710 [Luteimonas sp. TWI662]|uniref:hypothetical protein n=1 Tax=Luteimonas sp. TWI662 TaxID=3136789 RepID=UPI003208007D
MSSAWQPGRLYPPGALVVPRTQQPIGPIQIPNPSFEAGLTDWVLGGTAQLSASGGFSGPACVVSAGAGEQFDGSASGATRYPVRPGQQITLTAMGRIESGTAGTSFSVVLLWFDGSGQLIGQSGGAEVTMKQAGTAWRQAIVSALAPANAASVQYAGVMNTSASSTVSRICMDAFSWNYTSPIAASLQYRAVQPAAGVSGSAEPAWPGVLGQRVTDNEVIWEAVSVSRVVWEARPIMRSGPSEPTWPQVDGARVIDGTISWVARTRRVTDSNCPRTPVTTIGASKVFKADGDIVRFSATANPLDWTTTQDAGYLPTGLQQANANDMAVLGMYRGNLVAFNASSFQMWQIDPDPEAMAILDQMDGIGSSWPQAAQAVSNDLFYLSQLGVRTVGIANAAENLAAGDVGMPIDELVRADIAAGGRVLSTYYPGAGQFWLAFARDGRTSVHVYSMARAGQMGAWSRYEFPFAVEAFAQLGDDLYVRHGDQISVVSEAATHDEVAGVALRFPGVVWWPWLDFGTPGVTKMLEGFDYVGTGQGPSISIGYDQRSDQAFTPPYEVPNDTLPGGLVPLPVSAPTLSVRLTFAGGERWNVQSVLLELSPMQGGP